MGRTKGAKGTKGTKGCFTGALHLQSGLYSNASLVLRGWEAIRLPEIQLCFNKAERLRSNQTKCASQVLCAG